MYPWFYYLVVTACQSQFLEVCLYTFQIGQNINNSLKIVIRIRANLDTQKILVQVLLEISLMTRYSPCLEWANNLVNS